jgi:methylase of polypeptide subunit release factors
MPEPTVEATATTPASPAEARGDRRNTLNALTGRDWIKFTKSWFICDSRRYLRNKDTELHPARFPEEMVSEFIEFFTKPGEWVLDPFCGSGATLVACQETGRHGVGVELSADYAQVARRRLMSLDCDTHLRVLQGDAREAAGLLDPARQFDFIITSPPYFNMLRKSRGGVDSAAKKRARAGLDTHYGDDRRDLGNIADYEDFVEELGSVFDGLAPLLKPRRYLVVVIQNLRDTDGEVRPLAWDLTRRLSGRYSFQGERIWCQNSKPLGIWGYPTVFVPNVHHHYCLIFRLRPETPPGSRDEP